MHPDTILLLKSAEHWLDNYDRATEGQPLHIDSEHCPLCQAHLRHPPLGSISSPDCGQCPIAVSTQRQHCKGTPYYRARDAYNGWSSEPLRQAVIDEYAYLVELAFRHHEAHSVEETSV